ncbi:aldehyde dehydrogenase family protein [Spirillospora sp. NPDC048819]|uniref:aldehyde dehydrogenase family protein n=1 Tax=Spirillospora sp. NPDC048819 TaxID=3155268 RepID=UPI0033D46881
MIQHSTLHIGGQWVSPQAGGFIDVVNPATEQVIGRVPEATAADVDAAVAAARTAFDTGAWPGLPVDARIAAVQRIVAALEPRTEELVDVLVREIGSPVGGKGGMQVRMVPTLVDTLIGAARAFPWEEERKGPFGTSVVRQLPIGVVGAIVSWNGPLFLTMQKLVPALIAGCTVVLKPSPEAPLTVQALAECIAEAGLPPGTVNVLHGGTKAGAALSAHPGVDLVSFTGGAAAGRAIGRACGEQIKPCVLELGGKSAAVLLDDGDLDRLVPAVLGATFGNNGQQCYALSRVLAPRSRYAETVEAVGSAVSALRVGDPLDPETEIGPLISVAQRDRVLAMVERAVAEGARVVTGGGRPPGLPVGYYVRPTVLADVDHRAEIAQEEVFGPVVTVIPYDGEEHAITLANDSRYGLSGAVFGEDARRAAGTARRIRTGMVTVNGATTNWAAPFGGLKDSGLGREYGPEGLRMFLEPQSLHLTGN